MRRAQLVGRLHEGQLQRRLGVWRRVAKRWIHWDQASRRLIARTRCHGSRPGASRRLGLDCSLILFRRVWRGERRCRVGCAAIVAPHRTLRRVRSGALWRATPRVLTRRFVSLVPRVLRRLFPRVWRRLLREVLVPDDALAELVGDEVRRCVQVHGAEARVSLAVGDKNLVDKLCEPIELDTQRRRRRRRRCRRRRRQRSCRHGPRMCGRGIANTFFAVCAWVRRRAVARACAHRRGVVCRRSDLLLCTRLLSRAILRRTVVRSPLRGRVVVLSVCLQLPCLPFLLDALLVGRVRLVSSARTRGLGSAAPVRAPRKSEFSPRHETLQAVHVPQQGLARELAQALRRTNHL
mmetsp:Transcript_43339/g.94866  ORF Transcript_43339/g.94866 Transcript_43339/m.94866 type:complete len:350 (+) Transcript_43339:1140-2189(+)